MPGMDRTGPAGAGPMTSRGLGQCGAGAGVGRGFARGRGLGGGRGMGLGARGRGLGGRGLGWFSVGYNGVGYGGVGYASDLKSALEERAALLRAELARTDALLAGEANKTAGDVKEPGEDSGR